jgi:putative hydrolase of the HAD superfamily
MFALNRPKAILLDYGGTLVEELGADPRAGTELMLSRTSVRPPAATFDAVQARANRVSHDVTSRRAQFQIETPWISLTRLIYDPFGVEFDQPLNELELDFWKATVTTRAMPGAAEALAVFRDNHVPIAVLSNSSFGPHVIRYELNRHGLAGNLSFVMVSAEYAVRKPNPLLFETAAARIGALPADIWFVGDSLVADVSGARATGMTAVWLPGNVEAPPGSADLIASDWPSIVEAFLSTTK